MILFPNAKINLGLRVKAKRPDGYHELETVFYPLPVHDILEGIRSDRFSFSTSGRSIPGTENDNLILKTWQLLSADFQLSPVSLHLHKKIPMGAGLGGGSSDAAFTLLLLNELFQLALSAEQLRAYALQLGSDCPFFLFNQPALASGRGEILTPLSLPALAGKKFVLVAPPLHISTGWAFAQLEPRTSLQAGAGEPALQHILEQPVANWKGLVVNDFEAVVVQHHPVIGQVRDVLYEQGAVYASLTGSGAALYGIFDEIPSNIAGAFPADHEVLVSG